MALGDAILESTVHSRMEPCFALIIPIYAETTALKMKWLKSERTMYTYTMYVKRGDPFTVNSRQNTT